MDNTRNPCNDYCPCNYISYPCHRLLVRRSFLEQIGVIEQIQLVGISVQEIILSVIYSWEAAQLLRLRPSDHYHGILVQLQFISLTMVCADAAIIGSQYAGSFIVHITLKAMAYRIKLNMEYAILGRLVHVFNMMVSCALIVSSKSDEHGTL